MNIHTHIYICIYILRYLEIPLFSWKSSTHYPICKKEVAFFSNHNAHTDFIFKIVAKMKWPDLSLFREVSKTETPCHFLSSVCCSIYYVESMLSVFQSGGCLKQSPPLCNIIIEHYSYNSSPLQQVKCSLFHKHHMTQSHVLSFSSNM